MWRLWIGERMNRRPTNAKPWNVLVFPGGTEIGLEIHRALAWRKEVRLFSASEDVSNHAPFVFRDHFHVPNVHDPSFVDILNRIVRDYEIDFIFPAHDDVIVALALNAHKLGASIVTSPMETCLVCRSKSTTYSVLSDIVPVPKLFNNVEEVKDFPVFVKPDKGQGARQAVKVRNALGLQQAMDDCIEPIILEYLPGDEYTIDCFTDRNAGLLFSGGRQRVRVRNGISFNSRPVDNAVFHDYAIKISKKLKFHGAWFFQLKEDARGILKLLEVAPRIAGTMATYRVLGINFPLLSIYEQIGVRVDIVLNNTCLEIDRAITNRYKHNLEYHSVYVDLDDTLVVENKVNVELVRFLYQCINNGKTLILLTKHEGHIGETLKRYRLFDLFDEIIQIEESESKADHIHHTKPILIDDSFSERKAVSTLLGIPTFDSSMIEMLIDERV
jgi:hypothetical protein